MTLTECCVCMVDSCWRKGICEFCVNNHGGDRTTVSCALSAEAYAARKRHWDQCHDEPQFPTNTALGILSKETMETSKSAILALRDAQTAASRYAMDVMHLKTEQSFDPAPVQDLAARLEQLSADLRLVIEQAEAAVRMGETVKAAIPSSYC